MRNNLFKIATAAIVLAIALTLYGCPNSGGDSGGGTTCGGKAYDTGKYGCVNDELVGTCGGSYYNPENERCLNGEIQNGAEITFPSSSSTPSGGKGNAFKDDRDGKSYKWVKIGAQTWMAENLNYNASGSKCYGEGGQVVEYTEDDNDESITSTLSNAEIQANCATYGKLYNWSTAMSLPSNCNTSSCASQVSAKHRGICPSGWHIPSDAEWDALMNFVNPSCSENIVDKTCAGAGIKLKATSGWNEGGNGEDTYSFAALPSGYGDSDGYFYEVSYRGFWWSVTEYNANIAYHRRMGYSREDVKWDAGSKPRLQSVRCVKD